MSKDKDKSTQAGDENQFPEIPTGVDIIGLKVGVSITRQPIDPTTHRSLFEPVKPWTEVEISTDGVDPETIKPFVKAVIAFEKKTMQQELDELGISSITETIKAEVKPVKPKGEEAKEDPPKKSSKAKKEEKKPDEAEASKELEKEAAAEAAEDPFRGLTAEQHDLAVKVLQELEDKGKYPKSKQHLGYLQGNHFLGQEGDWDAYNSIKEYWLAFPEKFDQPWE